MPDPGQLTERQAKWFASVRAGLERTTGRTVEQWAEIARHSPESAHRQRLAWLKAEHGLGQNHASLVLDAAFPAAERGAEPAALAAGLWSDPARRRLFDAVAARATALPDVVVGQRKGYTAFSRRLQFAAARPDRGGGLRLGLALPPDAGADLAPPAREGWSERLTAVTVLDDPGRPDDLLATLLRAAWERS